MSHTLWQTVLALLLLALTLAAAGLLVSAISASLLFFAGILFGIALNWMSDVLNRRLPLSYRWAYVVVVAILVALVAGGSYYMGAQFFAQVSQLFEQLQSSGEQLLRRVEQRPELKRYLSEVKLDHILSRTASVVFAMNTALQWLAWGITAIAVVFFVGLYVAYEPDLYEKGLVKLVPPENRALATDVLRRLRLVLGLWIMGRVISMLIVGVSTAIGLWMLQVPLPITLGIVAALLTFIPNFGPILATVPQALLALQVGTNTVLYVILFNLALQTAESYLITPIVQRHQVTLPPAMTIFAQLLMGVLFGAIGIIMAAPLTVTIMLVTQTLYIRDLLGDPRPGRLSEKS
jgi:predicted PurR-regulated permease PerM